VGGLTWNTCPNEPSPSGLPTEMCSSESLVPLALRTEHVTGVYMGRDGASTRLWVVVILLRERSLL